MDAPSRQALKSSFEPIVPVLREVIRAARATPTLPDIQRLWPSIGRMAHYQRLRGTGRWMTLVEMLIARVDDLPSGHGLASDEIEHNMSRVAFQFPMGIWMVKREPHDEAEGQGKWMRQRLDGITEQLQLADGVNAFAGVKAYLSVPPDGVATLICTHPALDEPITIALDEFEDGVGPQFGGRAARPVTPVRSTRDQEAEAGGAAPG